MKMRKICGELSILVLHKNREAVCMIRVQYTLQYTLSLSIHINYEKICYIIIWKIYVRYVCTCIRYKRLNTYKCMFDHSIYVWIIKRKIELPPPLSPFFLPTSLSIYLSLSVFIKDITSLKKKHCIFFAVLFAGKINFNRKAREVKIYGRILVSCSEKGTGMHQRFTWFYCGLCHLFRSSFRLTVGSFWTSTEWIVGGKSA